MAFQRLKDLGGAMVDMVDEKLSAGDTPSAVATHLHEMGHLTDLKHESLKRALTRYRTNELKPRIIKETVLAVKGNHTSVLKKHISAQEKLESLVALQEDRFHKVWMHWENKPNAVPGMVKAVREEARLLKEMLAELGKLQLETGLGMKRAPKRIWGTAKDEDGNEKQFVWTEEQDELFRQLETIDLDIKTISHASAS